MQLHQISSQTCECDLIGRCEGRAQAGKLVDDTPCVDNRLASCSISINNHMWELLLPKAQMSDFSLYGCSWHSSGEKYNGVPTPLCAQRSPVAIIATEATNWLDQALRSHKLSASANSGGGLMSAARSLIFDPYPVGGQIQDRQFSRYCWSREKYSEA